MPCPPDTTSAVGSSDESQCIDLAFVLRVYNIGEPIFNIPDFSTLPLMGTANVHSVNIPAFINVDGFDYDQGNEYWTSLVPGTPNNYFAATFTGFVKITTAGEYLLCLLSDDGSALSVDGVAVVQNLNQVSYSRQCGISNLLAGVHSLIVSYYQIDNDAGVLLTYSGPDTSNVEVVLQRPSAVSTFPSSIFYPPAAAPVDPSLS